MDPSTPLQQSSFEPRLQTFCNPRNLDSRIPGQHYPGSQESERAWMSQTFCYPEIYPGNKFSVNINLKSLNHKNDYIYQMTIDEALNRAYIHSGSRHSPCAFLLSRHCAKRWSCTWGGRRHSSFLGGKGGIHRILDSKKKNSTILPCFLYQMSRGILL